MDVIQINLDKTKKYLDQQEKNYEANPYLENPYNQLSGECIDNSGINSKKRKSSEVIIPKEDEVEAVEIRSGSATGGDGQGDSQAENIGASGEGVAGIPIYNQMQF